ncbi:MAG TPA: hypothetical protein VI916_09225 [Acidimicrobiia bacterium]|nr:hypothetical protein [Acidimicrobiia bacterium]
MKLEDELRQVSRRYADSVTAEDVGWDAVVARRARRQQRRAIGSVVTLAVVLVAGTTTWIATGDNAEIQAADRSIDLLPDRPPPLTGTLYGLHIGNARCNKPPRETPAGPTETSFCPLQGVAALTLSDRRLSRLSGSEQYSDVGVSGAGEIFVGGDFGSAVPLEGADGDEQATPLFSSSTIAVARDGQTAWIAPEDGDGESVLWVSGAGSEPRVVLRSPTPLAAPAFGPDGSIAVLEFSFQPSKYTGLTVVSPQGRVESFDVEFRMHDNQWGFGAAMSWSSSGILAVSAAMGVHSPAPRETLLLDPATGAALGRIDGYYGQAWSPDGTGLLLARSTEDRRGTELAIGYGPELKEIERIETIDGHFSPRVWLPPQ